MGTKDVSAAGGAVGQGDDAVHVDRGLAVEERDVADEGSDFDLLVDGDDAEHFFVFVEPREAGVVESADGSEVCGLDVVVGGELGESGVGLVARFKDDGEIALAIGVVEEFDLHAGSGAVGTGFGGREVLRGLCERGEGEEDECGKEGLHSVAPGFSMIHFTERFREGMETPKVLRLRLALAPTFAQMG